jgi:predicted SAM-dependent methyltransferase
VKVCKRPLVNEVRGLLPTEFFPDPTHKGATPNSKAGLLAECHRVLEPGGVFTFGVPDGETVLRHFVTGEHADYAEAQLKWNPTWCRTQMDHVNYCMRQNGEHRWYYDEETMRLLLEEVGFVEVERRDFDSELDQEERRVGSMYMRCKKP